MTISTPGNGITKIFATSPGMTKVRLEISDANDNILDFDETEICCPQFVFVAKSTASYTTIKPGLADSNLFDAVLREYKVVDSEVKILEQAKAVVRQILKKVNVRVIWDGIIETPSSFIGSNNANTVSLQG